MKLYRYELFVDDESQDVGIFQGMSELDIDEDMLDALSQKMDEELQIPIEILLEHKHTKSWFTQKGKSHFLEEIVDIIQAYMERTIFEVKELMMDINDLKDIVYQDEFQVIQKI